MDTTRDRIEQIARDHQALEGALLPILHEVQALFGYLPPASVSAIAQVLNLSRAEVHGVISFYHLLRTRPPGRKTLFLCRSEACQAVGGARLADRARARLGIDWHQTTDDGRWSLEPVYCLGNCACSPAAMVDDRLVGRLSPERLDALLDD